MTVVYERFGVTVHAGDCLDVLAGLPDGSVHAVVTDPPYGIRFMGKAWDGEDIEAGVALRRSQAAMPEDGKAGRNGGYRSAAAEAGRYDLGANAAFGEWCRQWAAECLRVLTPGGHMLAFGGSRTWHRLTSAVEDAGFEIRDSIAWLYASGFPKSLDVSKAIDKAAGADRPVGGVAADVALDGANRRTDGTHQRPHGGQGGHRHGDRWSTPITSPGSDNARQWQGWGTALKPAFEPIVVGRKPLAGTVAATVLEHGTGALNIDGGRVGDGVDRAAGGMTGKRVDPAAGYMGSWADAADGRERPTGGRWPSNVVLTHAEDCTEQCAPGCPTAVLDEQSGVTKTHGGGTRTRSAGYEGGLRGDGAPIPAGDSGGASRFFPVFRFEAKAPSAERPRVDGVVHPTVKPLALMRWLVRLVTPPGGVVLDPFLGSGTTAQAARAEGFRCVGIERDETYLPLIHARLAGGTDDDLFGGDAA